jgi:hypothetical protein
LSLSLPASKNSLMGKDSLHRIGVNKHSPWIACRLSIDPLIDHGDHSHSGPTVTWPQFLALLKKLRGQLNEHFCMRHTPMSPAFAAPSSSPL